MYECKKVFVSHGKPQSESESESEPTLKENNTKTKQKLFLSLFKSIFFPFIKQICF